VFGVTKTDRTRTITLGAETIAQLRDHRRAQAELRMRNRTSYKDFGLIFAKEPDDLQTPEAALGQPIATLSEARFVKLVKQANVKSIKFHGLRHTCATLLLEAGTPVNVVAQRLGHAKASMTLDTYAHALTNMQHDAAARLGALLHG
jgi:integrase